MNQLVELPARPEWSHQTTLDCNPAPGLARAFVSHHLVAHRLFHLVDLASVVVVKLTGDAVVRPSPSLVLTMAKAGTVLLLRVEDTSGQPANSRAPHPVDATFGSGAVGLLTLQWGVTRQHGESIGLWATLDARRHRRAVATVESGMTFTGAPIPRARGPGRIGGGSGRSQLPHSEVNGE